jgi:DNA-binding NarL/FixJ family response regulator
MDQSATHARKFKVGLCESQPATAEGLRSLLETTDHLECVWAAPQPAVAMQLTRQLQVDVLLLDKHTGQQAVIRCLEQLRSQSPPTAAVVWGASLGEAEGLLYLQAGARGLLKKTAGLPLIVQCLTAVARGAVWIDENVAPGEEKPAESLHQLTPREHQVLELVRQGLRNREIAAALGIRPGTVKIHLRHIFEKTGIHGRYTLALNLLAAQPAERTQRAEVA